MSRGPLAGATAIVTGASSGIGFAIARALTGAGARVAMLARGAERLRARATDIGSLALPLQCDVGDAVAVQRAAGEARAAFGSAPDILVSNAGLFPLARVEETSIESFARTLDVNLLAPFVLARTFLGDLRARGRGHLVTIGSIADRVVFPENSAYAASKFGARALHEVLRQELRGTGVRATLVSPGPVDTPLWDAVKPETRPGFTPRSAMLEPADVADAVLYAVTRPPHVDVEELRLGRS
jgi:NADP-dependent 3-hydroxy acid dehydrogenase YdfG